jgi:hypothetical protein
MKLERLTLTSSPERVTFYSEGNTLFLRITRAGRIETHKAPLDDKRELANLASRAYLMLEGAPTTQQEIFRLYDLEELVYQFQTFYNGE